MALKLYTPKVKENILTKEEIIKGLSAKKHTDKSNDVYTSVLYKNQVIIKLAGDVSAEKVREELGKEENSDIISSFIEKVKSTNKKRVESIKAKNKQKNEIKSEIEKEIIREKIKASMTKEKKKKKK